MIKIEKPSKWEDVLELVTVLLFLVLLNILGQKYFSRLDLSEEKRYSISEASQNILRNLDEQVYIEVYLTGDLNTSFKRLERSIREKLEDFSLYGGQNIQYRFVNPDDILDTKKRNEFYQDLTKKGLSPTNLYETVQGKKVQKTIVPGVVISYKNKEQGVLLLKGNKATSPSEQLNQSIENVEYELISAIQRISIRQKPLLAFIEGYGQVPPQKTFDFFNSLSEQYIIDRVNLKKKSSLLDYDAIILAQPKERLQEAERYKIDQFIMHGGKALFFIDKVQMELDSIAINGAYAFGYDLNIDDMLFRYGVRINLDLVQDQQAGSLLINVGRLGDKPNLQKIPFPYYPVLNTFSSHPIVKNLDAVYTRFVSTIDTVKAVGVRKTPLIFTSKYTRVKKCPTLIELNELRQELDPKLYTKQNLPVAYLLEGNFKSIYHFPVRDVNEDEFLEKSKETKIIVCADGDFLHNELNRRDGSPLPLGYDQLNGRTFMNKELIINALTYLLDENGIIKARSNEVKMRPLDKFRIQEERMEWQAFNLLVPLGLIIAFGLIKFWFRKKKWTSKK
jgi:gliding-associated putative ABC transporter substrate-binding component GldG